jgi:hypothetical protein
VLTHPTLDQRHQLGLAGMAGAFAELEANPQSAELSHDIDYRAARGLDRSLFQTLIAGGWIEEAQNLIIEGPAGVGKSWLACVPRGAEAVQRFFSSEYTMRPYRSNLVTSRTRLSKLILDFRLTKGKCTVEFREGS